MPQAAPKADPAQGPVSPGPVGFGALMVPAAPGPAPSAAETLVGRVAGLVWPVMIMLALMGVVGWWPAVLVAIVASAVLSSTRNHLKARRRALGGAAAQPDTPRNGLRGT